MKWIEFKAKILKYICLATILKIIYLEMDIVVYLIFTQIFSLTSNGSFIKNKQSILILALSRTACLNLFSTL